MDAEANGEAGPEGVSARKARIIEPCSIAVRFPWPKRLASHHGNVGAIHGNGGRGRNRTADTGIFNPLLYQLSYSALLLAAGALKAAAKGRVLERLGAGSSSLGTSAREVELVVAAFAGGGADYPNAPESRNLR